MPHAIKPNRIRSRCLALTAIVGAALALAMGSLSCRLSSPTGELLDLAGKPVDPFAVGTNQWHVFFFVSNDCPISNRYAPEIKRLHDMFHPRGVAFWIVHPLRDETPVAIQQHTQAYQLPGTVLTDSSRNFTRFTGARHTPEAVLCTAQKELIYRGRIDNRFVSLGQARMEATEFDLRNAIEAALEHRPVAVPRTQAVGCSIPDLP